MRNNKSFLILTAAVLWGFMGVFLNMLDALTPMQAAAVRCGLAAILYGLFLLFFDKKSLRFEMRDIWMFLGSGGVSLLGFNIFYFEAIRLSDMATAAVLLYTAPAFVMLLSRPLFGERLTRVKLLSLFLTVAGCVFVSGFRGGAGAKAVLFGVLSGFFYALYSIFGKYALKKYSERTLAFYTFFIAALGLVPASRVLGALPALSSARGIAGAVGMAVVACLLPYVLYSRGLKTTEAGRASVMAALEPVTAAVLGAVLFHEAVTPFKALGMALVIGAIALVNLGKEKKTEEKSRP